MRPSVQWILCAMMFFVGCGEAEPNGDDDWQAMAQTDEGSVSLCANTADANGTVRVSADVCLSSSCSRNAVGTCDVTLDGTTITVTSQFDWEENMGKMVACTDDCRNIEADCGEIGPLAAGTYTIVHGASSQEVEVPSNDGC